MMDRVPGLNINAGSLLIFVIMCGLFLNATPALVSASGIDCFKCVSLNGTNQSCEDPFHNNYTTGLLESPCMSGRKGRNGLFPASACVKLSGTYADGSGTIMVRGCALDSGTLTTDTELIRMSHCGAFYYDKKYVHGCVQSCDDWDACNGATFAGKKAIGLAIMVPLACLIARLMSCTVFI
jgi:hypothetical protein